MRVILSTTIPRECPHRPTFRLIEPLGTERDIEVTPFERLWRRASTTERLWRRASTT